MNDLLNPWYIGAAVALVIVLFWKKGTSINQKSGKCPPERQGSDKEIEQFLAEGRKIEAIKLYRELYGVGLKEAKDAIEKLCSTDG